MDQREIGRGPSTRPSGGGQGKAISLRVFAQKVIWTFNKRPNDALLERIEQGHGLCWRSLTLNQPVLCRAARARLTRARCQTFEFRKHSDFHYLRVPKALRYEVCLSPDRNSHWN